MFGFIKKLKPLELEQQLSIRERALKVFSSIEGFDDVKEMMLRERGDFTFIEAREL